MKKKHKIIIIVTAVLCMIGITIGAYYYSVNYAFSGMMKALITNTPVNKQNPTSKPKPDSQGNGIANNNNQAANNIQNGNAVPTNGANSASTQQNEPDNKSAQGEKKAKTKDEIVATIVRTPDLVAKLESMVDFSDRQRAFQIGLSCFSGSEIELIKSKVRKGISSKEKDELIAMARSRITADQKRQLMQIVAKYADRLEPYIP